jgi:hypothetical protein
VPALPQHTAQPQFQSSELRVSVDRAGRNAAGQLSVTLLFSNISQENIALYDSGGAEMVTDAGDTALSSETIGVPVCTVDCQLGNAIIGVYVDPAVIARGNALRGTFLFPAEAAGSSCGIDFTLHAYVARLGTSPQVARRENWRPVTIALSNIRAC